MNVLVINPANKPFTNLSILAEPIDVLNIATVIKKKYKDVKVIDMDVERNPSNINSYLEEKENIIVFVYDYQLPLHTSEAIDNIFQTIKNTTKEAKFIIIGKTSTYFYNKFLDNGIDVVIKGIAEPIIIEVIDNIYNDLSKVNNIIYKENNKVIHTKEIKIKNDFKVFDYPNRDFLEISKYMNTRTIITSRGCINKCNFCTTPYFFGIWSGKSPEMIIEEIEMLINKYHTKKIMFLDDNMTVNKARMIELCNLIKEKNIKCLFGLLSSISCFDEELFKKMYEVGFRWVHFGIESGSLRILKLMNKKMDLENIKQVIEKVKNIGYRVRASFILDYPTTTKEDIIKTRNLIEEINVHELRLHYLAFRVGTPIYKEEISNKTQYIHSNKPNIDNDFNEEIDNLVKVLHEKNYNIVTENIDWNIFENYSKDTRIASFVPIKYGMCWYE